MELGARQGAFVIRRTGPTTSALQVSLSVTGSAALVDDYTLTDPNGNAVTDTVEIPAGYSQVILLVTPENDTLDEDQEQVDVAIGQTSDYDIDTSASAATVFITDF